LCIFTPGFGLPLSGSTITTEFRTEVKRLASFFFFSFVLLDFKALKFQRKQCMYIDSNNKINSVVVTGVDHILDASRKHYKHTLFAA